MSAAYSPRPQANICIGSYVIWHIGTCGRGAGVPPYFKTMRRDHCRQVQSRITSKELFVSAMTTVQSSPTASLPERQRLRQFYRAMLEIRAFEQKLSDLFAAGVIGGTSHLCIGQEACAVGVVQALAPDDYIVSSHRGHGHVLARGLEPWRVFAELLGRRDGYCGGRGGSQHLCSMEHAVLGTNGITGGGLPIATGAAFALKTCGSNRIVTVFFGDGASNQGTFHESLNMAALWKLPVLFVCENNQYGMSTPLVKSTAGGSIAGRAGAYGMTGVCGDGMDVAAVWQNASELAAYIRAGNGPVLLELTTYRYCGHSRNDPRVYRSRDEEALWQQRDCLANAAVALAAAAVPEVELATIRQQAQAFIDAAAEQALASALAAAPSG